VADHPLDVEHGLRRRDAARTVKRHSRGILRRFDSKIANGLVRGINSLIQPASEDVRLPLDPQSQGDDRSARRQTLSQDGTIEVVSIDTKSAETIILPGQEPGLGNGPGQQVIKNCFQ